MAMKARLANHIRKTLYKKHLSNLSDEQKIAMFDQIFGMNLQMHWELNAFKQKRKDKAALLKKRLAAPQTKSMMKKVGPKKPNNHDYNHRSPDHSGPNPMASQHLRANGTAYQGNS